MAGPGLQVTDFSGITYNGIAFPYAHVAKVSATPVEDTSKRTIKYIEYSIEVTAIFNCEDGLTINESEQFQGLNNTDTIAEFLRRRLTQSGKELKIPEKSGFGNLGVIGTSEPFISGGRYDPTFGPFPKLLSMDRIGNRSLKVLWSCIFRTAECPGEGINQEGNTRPGGVTDFVYEESWDIGQDSMTVRTITGRFEMGNYIQFNKTLLMSPDQYRKAVLDKFPGYSNFRRSTSFHVNDAKTIMEFTIKDEEIKSDNPYHPGVLVMDIDQTIKSELPFVPWTVELSGSIEVAPGFPKIVGWLAFVKIIDHKQNLAEKYARIVSEEGEYNTDSWIPMSISLTEELYGRRLEFSYSYWIPTDIEHIFKATGIYKKLPSEKGAWQKWQDSMGYMNDPRGVADLYQVNSDDYVTNLCVTGSFVHNNAHRIPEFKDKDEEVDRKKPPAAHSYLSYQNDFKLVTDEKTITHTPLANVYPVQERISSSPESTYYSPIPGTNPAYNYSSGVEVTNPSPVMHKSGITTYTVIMTGHSLRVGYKPTPPHLVSYGGQKAVKCGRDKIEFSTIAGASKDYTIYMAKWVKTYRLLGTPITGVAETDGNPSRYV